MSIGQALRAGEQEAQVPPSNAPPGQLLLTVLHVAVLAHLELKEAEVETYRHHLDDILTYVESGEGDGQGLLRDSGT